MATRKESERRFGRIPGTPTKRYTVMLEEDDSEWAMKKPGGLSSMVRDLLRVARKNEERIAEADNDPMKLWQTPRVNELATHYLFCSSEGRETLLKVAESLRDQGQAEIYRNTADTWREAADELTDRVQVLEELLEGPEDYETKMKAAESQLEGSGKRARR